MPPLTKRKAQLVQVHGELTKTQNYRSVADRKHEGRNSLFRNGADNAVFVNTGQEFDGGDAGARPNKAVSWDKILMDAKSVKVYVDATIAFPLIVSQTFAKDFPKQKKTQTSI
ncbi:hypothetical protein BG005_001716 [Podila minutissima]|nr:hypothetical protein BG005_001716 [Podila minutissima]